MTRLKTNVRSLKAFSSRFITGGAWLVNPKWIAKKTQKNFFTPRRFYATPKQLEILSHGRETQLIFKHRKVKVWSWGEGEKVLLLHGWAGRGGQFYALIKVLVEAGLQPVTFDQPAHGDGQGLTNIFEFVQVTQEIEKSIGPLKAVVGHSMGCIPTLKVAKAQGIKTVLFAPGMKIRGPILTFAKSFGLQPAILNRLFERLEKKHGVKLDDLNPELQLGKLTNPVLILHDKGDKYTSAVASAEVSREFKHIKYHETENLGHNKILEDQATVQIALEFLIAS